MREIPSKFRMEDIFWEDVGRDLEATQTRCTVKCRGFPLHVTFIPSRFDFRNLPHDALAELLNIMPEWSAELWMTNADVHARDFPTAGMHFGKLCLDTSLADIFSIQFFYSSLVESIVSLWLKNIRDVQLHRIAVEKFPVYSSIWRLSSKSASLLPSYAGKSLEDIVTRFLFEVANHIVSQNKK